MLYLLDGDRLFQAGSDAIFGVEIPHLRQLATALTAVAMDTDETQIPLHSGVRPRGLVVLRGAALSPATSEAIGGLISISLDRVHALENLARGEAAKESERLRTLMIDSITPRAAHAAHLHQRRGDHAARGRCRTGQHARSCSPLSMRRATA